MEASSLITLLQRQAGTKPFRRTISALTEAAALGLHSEQMQQVIETLTEEDMVSKTEVAAGGRLLHVEYRVDTGIGPLAIKLAVNLEKDAEVVILSFGREEAA